MPDNLPESVADVLDDNATFEPAALAAVRDLARSRPWQGTDAERLAKFNACAAALCAAYQLQPWRLRLGLRPGIDRDARVIVFRKLSVVTFLHAMAGLRGMGHFARFRWSVNLFRRCFPRSFAACQQRGPFLVRE